MEPMTDESELSPSTPQPVFLEGCAMLVRVAFGLFRWVLSWLHSVSISLLLAGIWHTLLLQIGFLEFPSSFATDTQGCWIPFLLIESINSLLPWNITPWLGKTIADWTTSREELGGLCVNLSPPQVGRSSTPQDVVGTSDTPRHSKTCGLLSHCPHCSC